jgi:putative Holliday junction resolvase
MDGSEGTRADKTKAFAAWLGKATGLPVEFWDERLTTHQALRSAQEQKIRIKSKRSAVNQIAAVIILQCYLESRRPDEIPDQAT